MYSKILLAGWADMDFNSHMRNTAFLDKSADFERVRDILAGWSRDAATPLH